MKTCKYCGENKEENFYNSRKTACKKCHNLKIVANRKRTTLKAKQLLGGKCSKCGYDKCEEALEFHHKDPTQKDFAIGGSPLSRKKIFNEAKKCILLCANCHRELHKELRMYG